MDMISSFGHSLSGTANRPLARIGFCPCTRSTTLLLFLLLAAVHSWRHNRDTENSRNHYFQDYENDHVTLKRFDNILDLWPILDFDPLHQTEYPFLPCTIILFVPEHSIQFSVDSTTAVSVKELNRLEYRKCIGR